MKERRRYLMAAVAALAAGIGFSLWRETSLQDPASAPSGPGGGAAGSPPAAGDAASLGDPADEAVSQLFALVLPDPAGEPQPMLQFRDRPLVVNFWATWCAPCVEEMPELSELAREMQDRKIAFVGIAVDQASNVSRFVQKLPVSYPLVVAGSAGIGLVTAFGNRPGGLPFTVVLDAQGRILKRYLGKVAMADLRRVLTS